MTLSDDPQQRQGDGVITADGDQVLGMSEDLSRRGLDRIQCLDNRKRAGRHVTSVGDLLDRPRLDFERRVVGPQQLRAGPYSRRAEPGAGPV